MNNARLVYSTETGWICPKCQKPIAGCICKRSRSKTQTAQETDGILRIRREVKGRKGKTATVVTGFDADDDDLKVLAKQLKQHCGTGGSFKGSTIILQGDHREKIQAFLTRKGHKVKLAGG